MTKRRRRVSAPSGEPFERTTLWLTSRDKLWLEEHGGISNAVRLLIDHTRKLEEEFERLQDDEPGDDLADDVQMVV